MERKKIHKHRLKRTPEIPLEKIKQKITLGAKFIVFPYTISILPLTFTPMSRAYFIDKNENPIIFGIKYSIITFFLGWWNVPHGFVNSIKCLTTNLQGGIDVTEDILSNLDNESLKNKRVSITKIENIFIHIDKSDKKALIKALKKHYSNFKHPLTIYAGLFINVDDNERPIITLGFPFELGEDTIKEINTSIYKYFYNFIPFCLLSLEDNDDIVYKLKNQGEAIRII